ncbi:putative membrane protein [Pseudaminobacter salicylatoxidans]|uniref:Putative membrane protein n=1 Tax=Pseudaminobacter salicylatoxidans TaxID=93369 RepID=A0A316BUN7_PSESE|nr:DUF1624 domain-containing protein [Pseudaminobacter salicylatoxidans]PWJ77677.1 putative membrane protein [Pseudaminobacter salicylatoxidans]
MTATPASQTADPAAAPDQTAFPRKRIEALDIARGLALVTMAIYHFTWDLEFFGYVDPGTTAVGGWKLFARCIASSFLFLVGVSLVLAHGRGIRWKSFWRRFAMVAGAAIAISIATWVAMPEGFIFFGILHQIALASLLGLAFLRLPPLLTLVVAAAVIAAPNFLRSSFFDHPALWWVGLSSSNPHSNDYVPVFPWFGAVLAGVAASRLAVSSGLFARLAEVRFGRWASPLDFSGRHSLAFYLIHQPVLIACVWAFSQVWPAQIASNEVRFRASCERTCGQSRDADFCARYCACMLDTLGKDGLDQLFASAPTPELRARIEDNASLCTARTDGELLDGETP